MFSYEDRGVSPHKPEVKKAVKGLSTNIFPGAFCWIIEDILGGDRNKCIVSHADGAGTKSSLAYLYFRETGDATVFRGIAQDSLAMNINDLIAVGATGPFVLSNTIGRNAKIIPGEVIMNIIQGYDEQCYIMAKEGIDIVIAGGETADLGDVVRTTVVDTTLTTRMDKEKVIDISKIRPGLAIVGIASYGQSTYESRYNSGIGTNGFSALRHDILNSHYRDNYKESFAPEIENKAYRGRFRLNDDAPFSEGTIAEHILAPTRIYAPIIKKILCDERITVWGIVNNSGGGQTKCLNFGNKIHYVKDNPIPPPAIFNFIKEETKANTTELARTYNLGSMIEVFVEHDHAQFVVDIARSFGIDAQVVGKTEISNHKAELSLSLWGQVAHWTSADLV